MARIIQRLSLIHETFSSGVANPLELSPAPDSLQALFGYRECETSWFLRPWASLAAEKVKNLPAMQETWVRSLGQTSWRREWLLIPIIFFYIYCYVFIYLAVPGLICGSELLAEACGSVSPTRDRTRAPCIGSTESYPLDHQGSPHSNILAWIIPWTEEPGRLQSMGWQIAGHN